jgi:hypothetical protein
MLRDKCNSMQLEAHQLLDMVRAGLWVPRDRIDWALLVLGDWEGT